MWGFRIRNTVLPNVHPHSEIRVEKVDQGLSMQNYNASPRWLYYPRTDAERQQLRIPPTLYRPRSFFCSSAAHGTIQRRY